MTHSRWRRIRALVRKDVDEVGRQPALVLPAVAMVLGLSLPAFLLLVITPRLTGESLADSEFAEAAAAAVAVMPELMSLDPAGQAQAFVLQHFLMFSLIVPVLGSLSLAAQAVIGEKQARALEPLLATPLTTTELLVAKATTPFALSMLLMLATFCLYMAGMALWGERGVWRTLLWPRTLLLYGLLGQLVSWTALLLAAIVSSRVNDARTAQQLGGFVILPITALFVGQLAGQFLLGVPALLVMALALVIANVALTWAGVRVFQRETILMRWK
jgi:ABC-2 type transport system permease protein